MILIDTDVLIWYQRGNARARSFLISLDSFAISAVTYMELIQGLRNQDELRALKGFLQHWQTTVIQIDESISIRASVLMEQHFLANSLGLADALIASTALAHGLTLATGNLKHFRSVPGLQIRKFSR